MTAKTPGACAALRIVSKALGSLILVCQHTLAAFYEANLRTGRTVERAGFALAGRVDDVGERVCCMRFVHMNS